MSCNNCSTDALNSLIAAFNCTTPKFGREVNTQSGTSYTLVKGDANDIVEMTNGAANTVNIPLNATAAFSVGDEIRIVQVGAGATTVQGVSGVTVNGVDGGSVAASAQWKDVRIYKRSTNAWVAVN